MWIVGDTDRAMVWSWVSKAGYSILHPDRSLSRKLLKNHGVVFSILLNVVSWQSLVALARLWVGICVWRGQWIHLFSSPSHPKSEEGQCLKAGLVVCKPIPNSSGRHLTFL